MPLDNLLDYVYSHYPKQAKRSALDKNIVDEYFDRFWEDNNLSDDYFVEAVRKVRASA